MIYGAVGDAGADVVVEGVIDYIKLRFTFSVISVSDGSRRRQSNVRFHSKTFCDTFDTLTQNNWNIISHTYTYYNIQNIYDIMQISFCLPKLIILWTETTILMVFSVLGLAVTQW